MDTPIEKYAYPSLSLGADRYGEAPQDEFYKPPIFHFLGVYKYDGDK